MIKEDIQFFEQEYNFTILEARLVGSRAFNMANDNSDIDITLVFLYPIEEYVKLGNTDKVYERKIGDRDYKMFDLRKFLELGKKV